MERGGVSDFSAVERAVIGGQALLWIAWDGDKIRACAVTELSWINNDKVCTIVAVGGSDPAEWMGFIKNLENFARNEGCARIREMGRKGWVRVMKDYKMTAIMLEKDLTDGR